MTSWFSGMANSVKGMLGFENLEVVKGDEGEEKVDEAEVEQKQGLFKQLSSYIGKDITSMISLPVWIFEPHSFLQIMCEPLQFEELLKKASETDDPAMRLAYITAFLAGGYSCASRIKKPFNPILGETFEFLDPNGRWKFFAEQVSHHPPMGVAETVSDDYKLHLEMQLKTKLRPNSAEASVVGECYLNIPKFNEVITWNHLDTCANNVIIGGMWVDHYGDLVIDSKATGYKATIKFSRSGYFGAGRYELSGYVKDKDGKNKLKVTGKWNDAVYVSVVGADGTESAPTLIWKRSPPPTTNKWFWTPFNLSMNTIPEDGDLLLPPTDSRFRNDRRQLELGNTDLAGKEKHRLEEKQRAERKERETKQETYKPKYFQETEENGTKLWTSINDYWQDREERINKARTN
eukprot:TRINITY_DN281_c0_g1_i1.p1 TRINITY_DN281_c0_g1~~TRINITY_DN281_c0_g1_i1.p1  ORF type:complete len:405 (-),score=127.86 TRINITY_DN281_c0_g1_i1:119-1333(-)